MTATAIRRGARRFHHCRGCRRDTGQRLVLSENGYPQGRTVETYACDGCGLLILSMGDQTSGVPDSEGLVLWIVDEWYRARRRAGTDGDGGRAGRRRARPDAAGSDRWLDIDDLLGHLRLQIVVVWTKWDPARGVPFRAYAVGELRNDLKDWLRTQIGRDRPKPFADAVSLDDHVGDADDEGVDGGGRLEALLGGALDDDAHSLQDLRRAVVLRGRELAELDRKYGVGSDA